MGKQGFGFESVRNGGQEFDEPIFGDGAPVRVGAGKIQSRNQTTPYRLNHVDEDKRQIQSFC